MKLQSSPADLRSLQRVVLGALVQPLTDRHELPPRWRGRRLSAIAAELIKPNDRLAPLERLEIYARSYWFRLIDCVYDDAPALRTLLGEGKFSALVRAYLAKYPSRSFTLRNLCARLPQFIAEEPRWTAPHTALAHDIARFEWAQTVAFDGEARPKLSADDIADAPPAKLRLALQPHLTLLAMDWEIDDFVLAVKHREVLRGQASNAPGSAPRRARLPRVPRPRRKRTHVVVHGYDGGIYYKRIPPAAFTILEALRAGRPLSRAVALAGADATPEQVSEWFSTWTQLGWLCRR